MAVTIKHIRVRKEDSAFVYAILEASEGIASYSTLPHAPGSAFRDLELQIPDGFRDDVARVLQELGEKVYELETKGSSESSHG
jgi:hypothetical protein